MIAIQVMICSTTQNVLISATLSAFLLLSNAFVPIRSEEHTSELQSRLHLVCRLLLEKKKKNINTTTTHKSQVKYTRARNGQIVRRDMKAACVAVMKS